MVCDSWKEKLDTYIDNELSAGGDAHASTVMSAAATLAQWIPLHAYR